MRKKIIITLFIIIILIEAILPIKTKAFVENTEITSVPAKINHSNNGEVDVEEVALEENQMTGLNLYTGILMEPTVKFFTFVLDSIMSVFTGIMTQEEIQFVMVENDEKSTLPNFGNIGTSFTLNKEAYETATKKLNKLKYPRFTYTPEEIFSGEIDLFNINFIKESNTDTNWLKIRSVISEWYKVLRMVAIVGLLSILIYTGIKIILSSNSGDKAKYKQLILNWFVAVILAFSMQYIMAFILAVTEEVLTVFDQFAGAIQVSGGAEELNFQTNLMGLARFQIQQQHFTGKIGHLIIYTALVIYTFKFTFIYFKRVLKVAFLTLISPIVAVTYPIDKMNGGNAQGFDMWLKEFIFNALLQPLHYLLYYILVSSSLSLAVNNPVYGIVALMFISQAERILKTIFGFNKAKAGTVGGVAGAFATGAITTSLINHIKDPMHPLSPGKGSGNSGSSQASDGNYNDYEKVNFLEDVQDDNTLLGLLGITNNPTTVQNPSNQTENAIIPDNERFFERYRKDLPVSVRELGGLSFDSDGSGSFEDILKMLAEYKRTGKNPGTIPALKDLSYEELQNLFRNRIEANEMSFSDNNMQLQYIDGDSRTSSELLEEIMRLNEMSTNPMTASNDRRNYIRQSEKLMKKLKRRMAQNEYIQRNGGPVELKQKEDARFNMLKNSSETIDFMSTGIQNNFGNIDEQIDKKLERKINRENSWEKFKGRRIAKGIANVGVQTGKNIIKPVWDVEKGAKYNGERLAGNILKGVGGATVGIAAAAVQAGISITDGKYNALEGVATVGAGIAGVSGGLKTAEQLRESRRKDKQSLERYSEQWFNRDDVISNYNIEYPGEAKAMRRRAVNNYVSRGITDLKEQKQAIKYANMIKKQRGLHEEEADKIAVVTLQYKKNLTRNNSYMVLFDKKKKEKYLDTTVNAYMGSASKDSIRQLHDNLIDNVREFDRVNN